MMQSGKHNVRSFIRSLYPHIFLLLTLTLAIFLAFGLFPYPNSSPLRSFFFSVTIALFLVLALLFVESAIRLCAYALEDKNHFKQLKNFADRYELTYCHKIFSPDPRAAFVYGSVSHTHVEAGHFVVFPYNSFHSSYISYSVPTGAFELGIHRKNIMAYSHLLHTEKNFQLSPVFSDIYHIVTNDEQKMRNVLDKNLEESILRFSKKLDLNRLEIRENSIYIESNRLFDSVETIERLLAFADTISKKLNR